MTRKLTLPTDSAERKRYPILSGCIDYFPAAIAGVARWSVLGNEKHNPGEELHHARGKSMDHGDCVIRHTMDLRDLMAKKVVWTEEEKQAILDEVDARSWRALADAQRIHEMFGAPLAPAARVGDITPTPNRFMPTFNPVGVVDVTSKNPTRLGPQPGDVFGQQLAENAAAVAQGARAAAQALSADREQRSVEAMRRRLLDTELAGDQEETYIRR